MADLIKISVDVDGPIRGLTMLKNDQIPWAITRTLTMLAQDGQAAGREDEKQVFHNRNDWTVRNTKITPATKQTMMAEVYTDTSNRKTGAPDYLPRQEEGGERVPVDGRMHIAVPTKYLISMVGNGPIPAELRPKAMLGYAENMGKLVGRTGKLRRPSSPAVRGMYFFKVTFKSGVVGILGREVNSLEAYPMYIFVRHARILKKLNLEGDVRQKVHSNLVRNFGRAAAEMISNDRLRGTGLTVMF